VEDKFIVMPRAHEDLFVFLLMENALTLLFSLFELALKVISIEKTKFTLAMGLFLLKKALVDHITIDDLPLSLSQAFLEISFVHDAIFPFVYSQAFWYSIFEGTFEIVTVRKMFFS
jgi:hypothetical protein